MAKQKTFFSALLNGLLFENPTFVLMVGMCPTLAVTTAASNAIGMGLSTTAVLVCSNVFISLLRKVISEKIRIPAFIVVIASFVTMVEMIMKAYLPSLSETLASSLPARKPSLSKIRLSLPWAMGWAWAWALPPPSPSSLPYGRFSAPARSSAWM